VDLVANVLLEVLLGRHVNADGSLFQIFGLDLVICAWNRAHHDVGQSEHISQRKGAWADHMSCVILARIRVIIRSWALGVFLEGCRESRQSK
jgi:hypothetical protein